MMGLLERVRVVLVHPEGGVNVGSVCRAMMTMGLSQLAIVGVEREAFDTNEIKTWSVHAYPIFERAWFCKDLKEALRGTAVAAGVTRRRGAWRKAVSLLPEELAERLGATGPAAVVFGNERTGLTDEELAHCSLAVHIPANPDFPSLNLSHAVQIIAYALRRAAEPAERYEPVLRERVEELASLFTSALASMGYFRNRGTETTEILIRDVLSRAALHPKEAQRLESIFRTLPYLPGRASPQPKSSLDPGA